MVPIITSHPIAYPLTASSCSLNSTVTTASTPARTGQKEKRRRRKRRRCTAARMGQRLALVLLLVVTLAAAAGGSVADDFFSPLSPLLAPVMGAICKSVACGKGNCTVTSGLPGYRCDCEPGWTQMHIGDELRFLPCVLPNCSIDRACSNDTSAPAPAPSPRNFSLSADPCEVAYCGTGGTCKNATGLNYHCECKDGFSNLLNITTMPCYQNCSFGADCAALGINPFSNASASSPPPAAGLANSGSGPVPGTVPLQILLPCVMVTLASLAMGWAT